MFRWETEPERILRSMSVPWRKKLEWLRQVQESSWKCSDARTRAIRKKLRGMR